MQYFIVRAKCGHVGRRKYIPIDFPIRARNIWSAESIARQKPGVKHNRIDAIISVRKSNYIEYMIYEKLLKKDIYWRGVEDNKKKLSHRIKEYEYLKDDRKVKTGKNRKQLTRNFRFKRFSNMEKYLCQDVEQEYGISV